MDKFNKIIALSLILMLLALAIFILTKPSITAFAIQDNPSESVKTATFAVCEQEGEYTKCQDKIFASCNGTLVEIKNSKFICQNKEYTIENKALGETYLTNWTDSRDKNSIEDWASQ